LPGTAKDEKNNRSPVMVAAIGFRKLLNWRIGWRFITRNMVLADNEQLTK